MALLPVPGALNQGSLKREFSTGLGKRAGGGHLHPGLLGILRRVIGDYPSELGALKGKFPFLKGLKGIKDYPSHYSRNRAISNFRVQELRPGYWTQNCQGYSPHLTLDWPWLNSRVGQKANSWGNN